MMAITQITLAQLQERIKPAATRGIQEIVLHHTWEPRAVEYMGRTAWDGIRNYHMNERGWSDIGYHFGIGPDGTIWTLRPYTRSGAHVLNRNRHTIGVAMVGNFDVEDPITNGLGVAVQVVAVLVKRFGLKPENVRFHREFQDKTCPGKRIDLTIFRRMVEQELAGPAPDLSVVVDGKPVDVGAWLDKGMTYAPIARLAKALGCSVRWDGKTKTVAITTPGKG